MNIFEYIKKRFNKSSPIKDLPNYLNPIYSELDEYKIKIQQQMLQEVCAFRDSLSVSVKSYTDEADRAREIAKNIRKYDDYIFLNQKMDALCGLLGVEIAGDKFSANLEGVVVNQVAFESQKALIDAATKIDHFLIQHLKAQELKLDAAKRLFDLNVRKKQRPQHD